MNHAGVIGLEKDFCPSKELLTLRKEKHLQQLQKKTRGAKKYPGPTTMSTNAKEAAFSKLTLSITKFWTKCPPVFPFPPFSSPPPFPCR